jgi:hypothetical protein
MYFVLRNMEIHFEIFVHRTVRPTKWDKGHFSYFFFFFFMKIGECAERWEHVYK